MSEFTCHQLNLQKRQRLHNLEHSLSVTTPPLKQQKQLFNLPVTQYKSGEKSFTTACVHTHTIEHKPKDNWDFLFTHPEFTEENNTRVGTFTSPTGDVYFQCEITTIFCRQFFSTAYPEQKNVSFPNQPPLWKLYQSVQCRLLQEMQPKKIASEVAKVQRERHR